MVKLVALLKTNPNARIPGRPDNGEGKTTIQNAATTLVKLTKRWVDYQGSSLPLAN